MCPCSFNYVLGVMPPTVHYWAGYLLCLDSIDWRHVQSCNSSDASRSPTKSPLFDPGCPPATSNFHQYLKTPPWDYVDASTGHGIHRKGLRQHRLPPTPTPGPIPAVPFRAALHSLRSFHRRSKNAAPMHSCSKGCRT